jgi:hypothetical protein
MVGLSSATAIAAHSVDSIHTVSSTASSFFMVWFLLFYSEEHLMLNIPREH